MQVGLFKIIIWMLSFLYFNLQSVNLFKVIFSVFNLMKTEKTLNNSSTFSNEQNYKVPTSLNNNYSQKCIFCEDKGSRTVQFLSEQDFFIHLRGYHCSKEGSSYVCRFNFLKSF